MKTCLSLFSGGGGKTHGAIAAGYTPTGAVGNNPAICDHYRNNIGQITCASLLQLSHREFDKPDLLMASPPCPSFSVAKVGAVEGVFDVALANQVGRYIKKLRPKAVLIENVPQYVTSQSFLELMADLEDSGYITDISIFNAADFGVPQSRRRLFIRAVKGRKAAILRPVQTHHKTGANGLPRWRGWYRAIEDLIPDMPESVLTDRQRDALTVSQLQSAIVERSGYRDYPKQWAHDSPIGTLRASLGADGKNNPRRKFMDLWLLNGSQNPDPRDSTEPSFTLRASTKQKHRVTDGEEICRSINVPALVRLQGWPDGLKWSGDVRVDVRILGISVCPPMATALINSMRY